MEFLANAMHTALGLIFSCDTEVVAAVKTSLIVATCSILSASVLAIPFGITVGVIEFPGKKFLITILNTMMALPTVVIGLLVYGILSRQGPLGELGLLFTPTAMVIGQTFLAMPIVTNYAFTSVKGADPRIIPTALTLGASRASSMAQLVIEIRFALLAAVIAGFGRVLSEVGVAMMLGGNIRSYTRTMTTAIALETSKGEFAFGLALGLILMAVAFLVNMLLTFLQQR